MVYVWDEEQGNSRNSNERKRSHDNESESHSSESESESQSRGSDSDTDTSDSESHSHSNSKSHSHTRTPAHTHSNNLNHQPVRQQALQALQAAQQRLQNRSIIPLQSQTQTPTSTQRQSQSQSRTNPNPTPTPNPNFQNVLSSSIFRNINDAMSGMFSRNTPTHPTHPTPTHSNSQSQSTTHLIAVPSLPPNLPYSSNYGVANGLRSNDVTVMESTPTHKPTPTQDSSNNIDNIDHNTLQVTTSTLIATFDVDEDSNGNSNRDGSDDGNKEDGSDGNDNSDDSYHEDEDKDGNGNGDDNLITAIEEKVKYYKDTPLNRKLGRVGQAIKR
jgi:hypothetical protein